MAFGDWLNGFYDTLQLIYVYVEADDDNNDVDKIETWLLSQVQRFFYIPHLIWIVWDASITLLVRHAGKYSGFTRLINTPLAIIIILNNSRLSA